MRSIFSVPLVMATAALLWSAATLASAPFFEAGDLGQVTASAQEIPHTRHSKPKLEPIGRHVVHQVPERPSNQDLEVILARIKERARQRGHVLSTDYDRGHAAIRRFSTGHNATRIDRRIRDFSLELGELEATTEIAPRRAELDKMLAEIEGTDDPRERSRLLSRYQGKAAALPETLRLHALGKLETLYGS